MKNAPLEKEGVAELDSICDSLRENLNVLSIPEKIKVICAFGQLRGYTVTNRVADRYNNKTLSYENREFYGALVDSMDWSSIYRTEFRRFKTLSPLLHVVRSINRMDLGRDKMATILTPLFDDISSDILLVGNPKQLTEMVMISAKNRLVHNKLFEAIFEDFESKHHSYSEDLIGDLVRSFTTLEYYSEKLHALLSQHLPTVSHELSWWNVIDVAEYYADIVPRPLADSDIEVVTRLANECWKWIPDMRCGYAAKGLRVLSSLEVADKRTIRSLIRHIPRSLGKLHNNAVAESIISAVKVGYNPRLKYGRRYGSVLYRRLAAKLSLQEDSLKTVSSDLLVSVVEALATIGRSQNELFDQIKNDIRQRPYKYSENQLVTLDRVWRSLGFSRGHRLPPSAPQSHHVITVSNLAHLTKLNVELLPVLMERRDSDLVQVTAKDLSGLFQNKQIQDFVETEWLDFNLPSISSESLATLTQTMAIERSFHPSELSLALIAEKSNELEWTNLDDLVTFLASLLILSERTSVRIPSHLFELITRNSTLSLATLRRCQLISAHIRTRSGMGIDSGVASFLTWIENHLVSKYFQPDVAIYNMYVPNGGESDLNIFPVSVPLAIPDPRIDLRKLHQARTSTTVRRLLQPYSADSGIALLVKPQTVSVDDILTERYLARLGWTVKYLDPCADLSSPATVTQRLLSAET